MSKLAKILEQPPREGELALVRTTISMPWKLFQFSSEAIHHYGHSSLSGLIQDLIRRDRTLRLQEQFRTGIIKREGAALIQGRDGNHSFLSRDGK